MQTSSSTQCAMQDTMSARTLSCQSRAVSHDPGSLQNKIPGAFSKATDEQGNSWANDSFDVHSAAADYDNSESQVLPRLDKTSR